MNNPISVVKKKSKVFRSLSGLNIEEFENLLRKLGPIYMKSEQKRFKKIKRQRHIGGGRKKQLDLENQLLMLLMYYRVYLSQTFLGLLFNLHNCKVSRHINYLSAMLSQIFRIPERKMELSEENLSEEELIEIFIDATEQQIQRLKKGQKNYYSGKKKKHTLKNQVIIDKKGKILSVSKSRPGKMHEKKLNDKTKAYSTKRVKKVGDLGYIGIGGMTLPKKKPKGKELTDEEKLYNIELSKKRIKVEHRIGKMKIFQILAQRFRNPLKNHSIIFKNVAGLQT
ncbi:MAG: transposase [Ignavibacteria bacterium]|jgi:hypothetical protein